MAASITCAGKKDGAGAQALAIMSTLAYARSSGLSYVHTPFAAIAHNDHDDPQWVQKWERFFSLGDGEPTDQSGLSPLPIKRVDEISTDAQADCLYVVKQVLSYTDANPETFHAIRPLLRERYRGVEDGAQATDDDADVVRVAAHIRRGDVSDEGKNAFRFTGNERVGAVLDNVVAAINALGKRAFITIYSEGDEADFADITQPGMQFELGGDVFVTYDQLVRADVLLMAKSAFSYTAALLGGGACLYEPYARAPMPDWLRLDDDADFDRTAFGALIQARLEAREGNSGE